MGCFSSASSDESVPERSRCDLKLASMITCDIAPTITGGFKGAGRESKGTVELVLSYYAAQVGICGYLICWILQPVLWRGQEMIISACFFGQIWLGEPDGGKKSSNFGTKMWVVMTTFSFSFGSYRCIQKLSLQSEPAAII